MGMIDDGWPVLTTLHHPITVDRQLALSHATNPWQQFTQRRWFGFLRMQVKVARALPRVVTVSESSKADIATQMGVALDRMTVVPVGVDHTVFRPRDEVEPVPGPDHGDLVVRRAHEGAGPAARGGGQAPHRAGHRVGGHRQPPARRSGGQGHQAPRPGPHRAVRDRDQRRRAGPQLRPGPGGGGALPVRGILAAGHRGHGLWRGPGGHHRRGPARGGRHRRRSPACWCQPDDPGALAAAIGRLLDDDELRGRLGAAGRERVLGRFTWQVDGGGHRRGVPGPAWPTDPPAERTETLPC